MVRVTKRRDSSWPTAAVVGAALTASALVFGLAAVATPLGGLLRPSPATVTSRQPSPAGFTLPTPVEVLQPVLRARAFAPAPDAGKLAATLTRLSSAAAGGSGFRVVDPAAGTTLVGTSDKPMMPASTMKILTALVTLDQLDPGTRFETAVVSSAPGRLILVGGGDPFLSSKKNSLRGGASLADLAARTARALKDQNVTSVTLGYDSSRFSGPAWHAGWTSRYAWSVSPVTALAVDRPRSGFGPRPKDPARSAADAFATLLRKHVRVTAIRPGRAKAGATPVASVPSLPVDLLVERMLRRSDNDAAEVLRRQAAIAAGRSGSHRAGRQVAEETLERLRVSRPGILLDDGSGLSRENRVRPSVLTSALSLALQDPRFRPLLSGLPVGGVTGTLDERFDDKPEYAGRGVVHAKTGTLRDVTTLAGYLVTKDGSLLVFAGMANQVRRPWQAMDWLDRNAAALAACGCG
jgi:D-alanyl-D-alanine carboxypeptidase/D-alanyl-D-alanine-endopeptidase (penicillin-binding protein 4)